MLLYFNSRNMALICCAASSPAQRPHRHNHPGIPAGERGGAVIHDPSVALRERGDAGGHRWDHPGRGLCSHHLRGKWPVMLANIYAW